MSANERSTQSATAIACEGQLSIGAVADGLLETLRENCSDERCLKTGLIDAAFAPFVGIPRNCQIVLVAPPKMGKTTLAHQLAVEVVRRNDSAKAVYYTAEMPAWLLTAKTVAALSSIPFDKWTRGDLSGLESEEREKVEAAVRTVSGIRERLIYVPGPARVGELGQVVESKEADLLVVDYLQRLKSGMTHENRRAEIDEVLSNLLELKQRFNLAIITISSESRGSSEEAYAYNRNLGICKESGDIEYDADMIFRLQLSPTDYRKEREGEVLEKPNMILRCLASRLTEPGCLNLQFNRPLHSFDGRTARGS